MLQKMSRKYGQTWTQHRMRGSLQNRLMGPVAHKKTPNSLRVRGLYRDPERIRTSNLLIRSQVLYPVKLRDLAALADCKCRNAPCTCASRPRRFYPAAWVNYLSLTDFTSRPARPAFLPARIRRPRRSRSAYRQFARSGRQRPCRVRSGS